MQLINEDFMIIFTIWIENSCRRRSLCWDRANCDGVAWIHFPLDDFRIKTFFFCLHRSTRVDFSVSSSRRIKSTPSQQRMKWGRGKRALKSESSFLFIHISNYNIFHPSRLRFHSLSSFSSPLPSPPLSHNFIQIINPQKAQQPSKS